ncbi:MAG TPA: hypothetical protein VFI54_19525 [Solirubrobacteraceae bacterium]|nr:hypothetical protein [Solirubrobacteraceae bacterium]
MKLAIASVVALSAWLGSAGAAQAVLKTTVPFCQSHLSLCADTQPGALGTYVGHDEPSVEFKSGVPGSGNDMTYTVTLPVDPQEQPNASGAGGTTWNFELRPTFWFGLTLCDTESAPEFTKVCNPDTDANNLVGSDPHSPDYIGKHPGNAFMELQFYPPGYVEQFEGFGCTATQYCAAMTIDSLTLDQNHGSANNPDGTPNNKDCNNYILGGEEPINWAYVTRSGHSQAPANPLFTGTFSNPNFAAVNPNNAKDLFMNPGDRIRIHMHDTAAGFRVDMIDLDTGQRGSMTASIANGFGHILFEPHSRTCHEAPYAFHPEYSTANPRGNTWSIHTYNVAMSDEIGHFENCLAIDANNNCTQPGSQDAGGLDTDDGQNFCVPGTDSTLVMIDGCFFDDEDWDGQSYRADWPGTNSDPSVDAQLHPTPVRFTSPTTNNGRVDYSTVAFETDLPALETEDAQFNPPFCDQDTGANCVNPPNGAQFYPFFTTAVVGGGSCNWQEGGNFIPGTINHFGGSAHAEFGGLLRVLFPEPHFKTSSPFSDFNSGDIGNPCPAFGGGH